MQAQPAQTTAWDFTPVYDLIQSLSQQYDRDGAQKYDKASLLALANKSVVADNANLAPSIQPPAQGIPAGLGNFNQLWDFLGVQREAPKSSAPPFEASIANSKPNLDVYASDGALYYPPSSKSVQWRDEAEEGGYLAETQPDSPPEDVDSSLTKAQRKKRNRKARRAAELEALVQQRKRRQEITGLESGDDTDNHKVAATPARKAGTHENTAAQSSATPQPEILTPTQQRFNLRPRDNTAMSTPLKSVPNGALYPSSVVPPESISRSKAQSSASISSEASAKINPLSWATPKSDIIVNTSSIGKKNDTPLQNKQGTATRDFANFKSDDTSLAVKAVQDSLKKPVTPSKPSLQGEKYTIAAQKSIKTPQTVPRVSETKKDFTALPTIKASTPSRATRSTAPLVHQNALDRNWNLLLKLINNFPFDRASLLSPLQLSINRPQPKGIHVFVDSSNILIGYGDHFKRARGIPLYSRTPPVFPSFHALALLLERRRPVAKRVLAGSTPEVAAFEEAREVGYETSILDKVWKARELTEKQKRYAKRSSNGGYGGGYMSASGSDNTLEPQKPKWVEQAVDEILHLKMMESIIDTPVPEDTSSVETQSDVSVTRPTMVLATGDAAEAEYSSGFMKMVERALNKGWNVEVFAWSQSISMGYRNLIKRAKWGDRFKLVELDEYAEELFKEDDSRL